MEVETVQSARRFDSDRIIFVLFVVFWFAVFAAYGLGFILPFMQSGQKLPLAYITGFLVVFILPLAIVYYFYMNRDKQHSRLRRTTAKEQALARLDAEGVDQAVGERRAKRKTEPETKEKSKTKANEPPLASTALAENVPTLTTIGDDENLDMNENFDLGETPIETQLTTEVPAKPEIASAPTQAEINTNSENSTEVEDFTVPLPQGVAPMQAPLDLGLIDAPVRPPNKHEELPKTAVVAEGRSDDANAVRRRLDAPELPIGDGSDDVIDLEIVARVLNFQDAERSGDWQEAFDILTKHGRYTALVRECESVLEILEGERIFVEELIYRTPDTSTWRALAAGERGQNLANLASIRDRTALMVIRSRARSDQQAQEAFLAFQKSFIDLVADRVPEASDQAIMVLSTSRAGRAFALLGQNSGIIDAGAR